MKILMALLLVFGSALAQGCAPTTLYLWPTGRDATPNASASASLANPAATFCEQNTGQHVIQTNAQSAQTGYCVFTDRSYCEAWSYFNGECKPGDQPNADRILLPNMFPIPSPSP